jgi:hypothetical protein
MAYDTANGQLVLFGGQNSSADLADTWTWDGTKDYWIEQSPTTSPSAREAAAVSSDAVTGGVLLFGGFVLTGSLNDSWTWDGTNWASRSITTPPSARGASMMSYDSASNQTVLFGGNTAIDADTGLNDTWVWTGAWWQVSPAQSPEPRAWSQSAYDAATGQVVNFGGYSSEEGDLGDTWTFQIGSANLGTANVCPPNGTTPAPCTQSATLAFDVAANTTVGAINILTQGAPNLDFIATPSDTTTLLCKAIKYTSATTCWVDVTFALQRPGQRLGAVVLTDGNGNALATTNLSGIGVGPQVVFSPSTVKTLNSLFHTPFGLAVDGGGNVFVADSGNGDVREIVAAGGYTTIYLVGTTEFLSGGGTRTVSAPFATPYGVAVDASGNVFVADLEAQTIFEVVANNDSTSRKRPSSAPWAAGTATPRAWRWTLAATSSSPIPATTR